MIGPLFTDYGEYIYTKEEVHCWEYNNNTASWYYIAVYTTLTFQLAFPIIPILISCLISTWVVVTSMKMSHQNTAVNQMKRRATITILYVTLAYIIFNIPFFINQLLYLHYLIKQVYTYPDPYWRSTVMYWYSWSISGSLSVTMNAAINPLIYFWRIRMYRLFVLGLFVKRCERKRKTIKRNTQRLLRNKYVVPENELKSSL